MRKKIVSLLAVTGLLVCMFGTVIGVRALSSNIDKIEGILGAPVGDVSESDVRDIVNMVNQILNVANAPHTIPDGCPDSIREELLTYVNFQSDGRGYTATVNEYETLLFGNGNFSTKMKINFNGDTYEVSGTKLDGKIALSTMSAVLEDVGNINGNVGDVSPEEEDDWEPLDEFTPDEREEQSEEDYNALDFESEEDWDEYLKGNFGDE